MKRFLTVLQFPDKIMVFTEENYKDAPDDIEDWVWQYAPDEATAIKQHNQKVDEYEADPTKDTY